MESNRNCYSQLTLQGPRALAPYMSLAAYQQNTLIRGVGSVSSSKHCVHGPHNHVLSIPVRVDSGRGRISVSWRTQTVLRQPCQRLDGSTLVALDSPQLHAGVCFTGHQAADWVSVASLPMSVTAVIRVEWDNDAGVVCLSMGLLVSCSSPVQRSCQNRCLRTTSPGKAGNHSPGQPT